MESRGTVRTGVERMRSFAERFAAGIRPRVEETVRLDDPETGHATPETLAAEAGEGALVARVIWNDEGIDRGGCLLWVGQVSRLLGPDDRAVARMGDEEVATLDASLRLAVEEGADGEMPFEWSALERVPAGALGNTLREVGAPEATERVRLTVRLGESTQAFLLVMAADEPALETTVAGEPPSLALLSEDRGDARPGESWNAARSAALPVRPETPVSPDVTSRPAAVPAPLAPELRNLEHLLDVRLPLTIRLGSTRMLLDDILRLTPGAIVELDRGEDEPLDVIANGRVIARGEVVVVDERFGLRITEIGTPEERIRASV